MVVLIRPTVARLVGYEDREGALREALSYVDGRADYELSRHKANRRWFINRHGQDAYKTRLEALQSERNKCLLFRDGEGFYTHSGLAERIATLFNDDITIDAGLQYRPCGTLPWANKPKHLMRSYQAEAKDLLLHHRHAGVEHCTGAGKSRTILEVVKVLGLQTVVMAPSKSIAGQLYKDFVNAFGTRYIGMYGDGKKQLGKRVTIAIGASLTRVEPDTEEWEFFSKTQVLCGDESHQLPAATLEKVCFGVLAAAPYRFFFSATQLRNDGLDKLLEGITGPIVHRLSVEDCVAMGHLARPRFTMISVKSNSGVNTKDANEMTRAHLYYNQRVNRIAADFANRMVELLKRPTVILIDEVEQFKHLQPHLKAAYAFAHGPLGENKAKVPKEYWESDVDKLVDDFNLGKIPILIGTSCIATGTDLRVTEAIIYLQGGKSEIQAKQGVGRGTRGGTAGSVVNPWTNTIKTDCIVLDFDVTNVETTHRHANERRDIYRSVMGPINELDHTNVD